MTPLGEKSLMRKLADKNPIDRFQPYYSIGEAVALLLHPFAEVVLHDVHTGKIVRLWNAFSNRKAGDPSHLEGASDLFTDERVLGPYEKALPSRGRTKSITAALYDPDGSIMGYFCVNLDVSVMDGAISQLQVFVRTASERLKSMFLQDIQQQINYLVREYLLGINKSMDALTRQERIDLIAKIDAEGLFHARNAVRFVANAFSLSRASVYNLLAEAQARGAAKGEDAGLEPDLSDLRTLRAKRASEVAEAQVNGANAKSKTLRSRSNR